MIKVQVVDSDNRDGRDVPVDSFARSYKADPFGNNQQLKVVKHMRPGSTTTEFSFWYKIRCLEALGGPDCNETLLTTTTPGTTTPDPLKCSSKNSGCYKFLVEACVYNSTYNNIVADFFLTHTIVVRLSTTYAGVLTPTPFSYTAPLVNFIKKVHNSVSAWHCKLQ